ncbi:MAG: NAD(P)-binding domain-containing protein [Betaproteobacteria bacterium]|nr:NAD(P)-binding domain-containing protein [Betaproteobacteria bacterium]
MSKKIAVLGAGAIGSMISADLTQAGLDVTVIDQWPAQVEEMKANGLHIQFREEELRIKVRALHLCELASVNLMFDIVFLAVKGNDHRWLTEFIKPYLKSDGVLVGTQNGMNDDSIASIIGRECTIGCSMELSGEIFTPGLVQRNTSRSHTWFGVGELDGSITPRVEEIQSLLKIVGKCEVTGNIYGAKWSKLIGNTMTMGPYGLLGLKNFDAMQLPGLRDISVQLGKESLAVGSALGIRIEPVFGLRADEFWDTKQDVVVTIMDTLMKQVGSRARTAPVHDHIKGRRSEMEYIPGVVSRRGQELGIPTPLNDAVVEIDRQINAGERKMDPSNLEVLKTMVGVRS